MITHLGIDIGTSKIALTYYDPERTTSADGPIQTFRQGDKDCVSTTTYFDGQRGHFYLGFSQKLQRQQIPLDTEKLFLGHFTPKMKEEGRRANWDRILELKANNRINLINGNQVAFFTAPRHSSEHQFQLRPYRLLAVRLLGLLRELGAFEHQEQGRHLGFTASHLLPHLQCIGVAIPSQFDFRAREDLLNALRLALTMLWGDKYISDETLGAMKKTVQDGLLQNPLINTELYGMLDGLVKANGDYQRDARLLAERVDSITIQVLEEPVAALCGFFSENPMLQQQEVKRYGQMLQCRKQLRLPYQGQPMAQSKGSSYVSVMDGGAGSCDLNLLRLDYEVLPGGDDRFDPRMKLTFVPLGIGEDLVMPGMHSLDRTFALRCFERGPLGLPFWLIHKLRDVYSKRLYSDNLTLEEVEEHVVEDDIDRWLLQHLKADDEFGLWASLVRNTLCNLQQGSNAGAQDTFVWQAQGALGPVNTSTWNKPEYRVKHLQRRDLEHHIRQWSWMIDGALGRRILSMLMRWALYLFSKDPELARGKDDFIQTLAQWMEQTRRTLANLDVTPQKKPKPKSWEKTGDGNYQVNLYAKAPPPVIPKKALVPPPFAVAPYHIEFAEMEESSWLDVCEDDVERMEIACECKRFEFDQGLPDGSPSQLLVSGGLYHYPKLWERLAGPMLRNTVGGTGKPLVRTEQVAPERDVARGCCWAGLELGEAYEKQFVFRPFQKLFVSIYATTTQHNPRHIGNQDGQSMLHYNVFSPYELSSEGRAIPIGQSLPQDGICVIPFQNESGRLFGPQGQPKGFPGDDAIMQQKGKPHFLVEVSDENSKKLARRWVTIDDDFFDRLIVRREINPDMSVSLVFCPVMDGEEKPKNAQRVRVHSPPYMATRLLLYVAAMMRWGTPLPNQPYKFYQASVQLGKESPKEVTWFEDAK